jgi:hypothetical protein
MPDIHFDCPKCSQTIDAPEELATQLIDCPTCKETIEVPARSCPSKPPVPAPPTPAAPAPTSTPVVTSPPAPKYRYVEESGVALALYIIAGLEIFAAPIAGFIVGQESTSTGCLIFLGGLISGLILLGFARVIEHTYESAQRLRHIEFILAKDSDDKKAV